MSKYQETTSIIAVSRVFGRGKTQIPSDIRKIMLLKDGSRVVWKIEDGKIVVENA